MRRCRRRGNRRVAAALCDVQRGTEISNYRLGVWTETMSFLPKAASLEGSLLSSHFKMHSVGHLNLGMLTRARSHGIPANSMREMED
jgi:hypothetical protein